MGTRGALLSLGFASALLFSSPVFAGPKKSGCSFSLAKLFVATTAVALAVNWYTWGDGSPGFRATPAEKQLLSKVLPADGSYNVQLNQDLRLAAKTVHRFLRAFDGINGDQSAMERYLSLEGEQLKAMKEDAVVEKVFERLRADYQSLDGGVMTDFPLDDLGGSGKLTTVRDLVHASTAKHTFHMAAPLGAWHLTPYQDHVPTGRERRIQEIQNYWTGKPEN